MYACTKIKLSRPTGLLVALVLWSSLLPSALAQNSIYVVNIQKAMTDSVIGKAAKVNLESEVKKREASLSKDKLELSKLKQELEKLGEHASEQKLAAFDAKERLFARAVQDQRDELSRKNRIAVENVLKQVQEIVRVIAIEQKLGVVLEQNEQTVLFVEPQFDITERVVKQLDQVKVGM